MDDSRGWLSISNAKTSPRRLRSFAVAALVGLLAGVGCGEKKGALMLAVNTDMKAPKDVSAVSVTISADGRVLYSSIGRVTPEGDVIFPATLAIAEGDNPGRSVRVRVMAFQDRRARVLRDVRTSIPRGGRVALLRVPLNFVNDSSAQGNDLPDGVLPPIGAGSAPSPGAGEVDFFNQFQTTCPDPIEQTVIDGECQSNIVDSETLPDFDPGAVAVSTDPGACFDVVKCLAGARVVGQGGAEPGALTLQRETCRLQLNGASASTLNVALVTPNTGECVRDGECYVPIDRGAGGWRDDGDAIALPRFVCTLLEKRSLRLAYTTGACPPKTEAAANCTPPPPDAAACPELAGGAAGPGLGGSPQSRVAVQAVIDASTSSSATLLALQSACHELATSLDAPPADIEQAMAVAEPIDKTNALCAVAVAAIGTVRAKAAGALSATVDPPKYELSVPEKAACQSQCSQSNCDPKSNPPRCTGGALLVDCRGACQADAGDPYLECEPCASTCQGTCSGNTCQTECRAPAGGTVRCSGRCIGDADPVSCRGGRLEGGCLVDAKCDASCDVSVAAKADVPRPPVTIAISSPADPQAAAKLKAAIEAHLPDVFVTNQRARALEPYVGNFSEAVLSQTSDIKASCINAVAKSARETTTRVQRTVYVSGSIIEASLNF